MYANSDPRQKEDKRAAYVVSINLDLVIAGDSQEEITPELVLEVCKEQFQCCGPRLENEWFRVKRILSEKDIPEGWEDALVWNDNGQDRYPDFYIPSPLEALAEVAPKNNEID